MRKFVFITAAVYLAISCNRSPKNLDYELVPYSGDLKVESFDSTVVDENRFNYNNRIFKVGSSYTYNYQYRTADGQAKNFRFTEEDWEFKEPENSDQNNLTIEVSSGLKPFSDWYPDYNQTVMKYIYSNKESYELTGLIENEANIWLHPPREGLFRIMELNPFPAVQFPLEIGNTWQWSVAAGEQWSDERWTTWEGNVKNTMTYEILSKSTINSKWGELETWAIKGEATNRLGTTLFEAAYHDSLGFVNMHFTNIDGSTLEFDLAQVDY